MTNEECNFLVVQRLLASGWQDYLIAIHIKYLNFVGRQTQINLEVIKINTRILKRLSCC